MQLPEDWHKPAKLPSRDVLDFWDKFAKQTKTAMDRHGPLMYGPGGGRTTQRLYTQVCLSGLPLSDDQRASFTALMLDIDPVINLTSASLAMPDYTMETNIYPITGKTSCLRNFAIIMAIAATLEAKNGRCTKALDLATLPLRLIKRTDQANYLDHLMSSIVTNACISAIHSIASTCNVSDDLLQVATLLKQLRGTVYPGNIAHWKYGDTIGNLRYAAAIGYPVNLEPQTMAGYYSQSYFLNTSQYYTWIIANLPASDPLFGVAKKNINSINIETYRPKEVVMTKSPMLNAIASFLLGIDQYVLWHKFNSFDDSTMITAAKVSMTKYDLTQMHLARRIAELKGEPVPSALPDTFTSAPLQFSEARKAYYSVGPDKVDDKGALEYDPTNGTLSPGDIFVQREAP